MKILLVTLSNNADHQDAIISLYEQLKDLHDTYLLTVKDPKIYLQRSNHTWLVECPQRPGIELKTFDLITVFSIVYRLTKEKFDIIHFESLHVWNIPIMAFCHKHSRIYHVIHDIVPHEGDSQVKSVDFMNKVICKMADIIVLRNKRYIPTLIDNYNVHPDRVKHLELWRHYPSFTPPVYSNNVLFFGRLNPYKGINNLLEIVRLCPKIRFTVVGRVDPKINNVIEELKKEKNVHLVDSYVSDEDMQYYFKNSDWIILPYNSATQSGVIVDAYKYSRPVIAFNVGAISEQIEDTKSGFLINENDNRMFADKIMEAIQMQKNEYLKMCVNAYQYGSSKYAATTSAKRFLALIES